MKLISMILASALLVLSCAHKSSAPTTAAAVKAPQKEWIRLSDEIAARYSKALAEYTPEGASWMGFTEFDAKAVPYDNTYDARRYASNLKWIEILTAEEKKDYPLETKEDILILKDFTKNQAKNYELNQKYAVMDFNPVSKGVFNSLQSLLNPQVAPERMPKAVDRFKSYVMGFESYRPYAVSAKEYYQFQLKQFKGKKILYPVQAEVELYLKESPQYVAGVEELLKTSGRDDWKDLLATFKKQIVEYDAFVTKEILPKARKSPRFPKEIYALSLKQRGMSASPEELIVMGEAGYKQLYPRFAALAAELAKKYNIKSSNPADVVAYFKQKQIVEAAEVEKLYHDADARLKAIIETNSLVSLPKTPLSIRLAGEAESLAAPVPHLTAPRFVGNTGERPEFVVPTAKDKMPFDDFSHEFAAIALTAHEGRPGHDLQFSGMIDVGVSTIRAIYAMNSVNAEGWALYAEDLVYPYVKDEEKFFLLEMRLWRMARTFLDPQIQLGLIPDQRVLDVFTKELGVSKEMAALELRRYSTQDPGQAPSYYYGYLLMKKARDEGERTQGAKFNLKCFNDQVLSYGLLPLPMILEKVQKSAGTACGTTTMVNETSSK